MSISKYIGKRGYTIYKECLSDEDLNWIKNNLIAKPRINGAPVQPPCFPIYFESTKKIYIPKFFGIDKFGDPDKILISDGEPISVKFNGTLRDYQKKIVDAYMLSVKSDIGGGLLDIPCGYGKTACALNIISRLSCRTLVIVHKSFLLDQWIERIHEFLPGATIGRIQGNIIDIENKDIVIGMLQSLCMKRYNDDIFDLFGLVVVDECHHIPSEVFSRALLKIVTRYTLGLSATLNRKDGLTPILKMFLGEVVYKIKREANSNVLVKTIQFTTNDYEFREVIYDYKQKPQYSSMITKLCNYKPRTEFIFKVINNELEIYPEQQILILGQNKSILIDLYKYISEAGIYTTGYYVGGMKQDKLKESESKKIIIATYSMAAEGLDIKSLSTLVLVTPRTDIVQAVGRILRIKHKRPLIIDITDMHDIFNNQSKKRIAYYKKNNYIITKTNNIDYFKNKWENIENKKKRVMKCNVIL